MQTETKIARLLGMMVKGEVRGVRVLLQEVELGLTIRGYAKLYMLIISHCQRLVEKHFFEETLSN